MPHFSRRLQLSATWIFCAAKFYLRTSNILLRPGVCCPGICCSLPPPFQPNPNLSPFSPLHTPSFFVVFLPTMVAVQRNSPGEKYTTSFLPEETTSCRFNLSLSFFFCILSLLTLQVFLYNVTLLL